MKISNFIPGLSRAYESVRNVFNDPDSPYLVFQNHGVHHQCWYDIEILIPTPVWDALEKSGRMEGMSATKWTEKANYYCSQINVPSSNLTTTSIRVGGGDVFKLPYTREYGNLIATFYLDGGYVDDGGKILKGFQGWIDYIFDPVSKHIAYYREYVSPKVKVTLYTMPDGNPSFGKGGKEVIGSVTFHEAYPSNIENIQLSGQSSNEPTQLTVEFNYRYFTTDQSEQNTSVMGKLSDMVKGGFRVVRGIKNKVKSIKTAIKDVGNVFK